MATSANYGISFGVQHEGPPTCTSSYTFVDPLPEKYICEICKNLLRQPHVTECCGQHFCEECLKKSVPENRVGHFNNQNQWVPPQIGIQPSNCPHCRHSSYHHIRYLPFKREINRLKVHCPRKSSGCNVQVAYGNRADHNKTCGYIRVPCTKRCGKTIFKKDLHFHNQNDCVLRKTKCKSCGKVGTYMEIECFGHNSVCPEVILQCTNSCGAQMKRKAAEYHDLVCPEATVESKFAEAGCEVKPKRKDLESHLDANMKQHLSQLMTAHVTMKQEFQAYKESHKEKDQHAMSPPSLGEQAHETASKKTSPLPTSS